MKTAVTESAPAAEREPASQFLPRDRNYLKTGELPEGFEFETAATQVPQDEGQPSREAEASAASQEETQQEETATSGEQDGETAAASQAAQEEEHQEQTTGKQKTQQTSESRWAKLSRENRELRERLARLEGREEGRETATQRDSKQASQPAADKAAQNPEPQATDKDPKTGKLLYPTYDDYAKALRKWDREEAARLTREELAKTQREEAQRQATQRLEAEVNKRVEKARKEHADYDDVTSAAVEAKDSAGRDLIYIPEGSHLDFFFLDSPRSQDVFYEIASNLDQYAPIFARNAQGQFLMSPVRQLRELAKIENSLEGGKPAASSAAQQQAPPKPVTQAGKPPHQTSGKGSVQKDGVQKAVEEGDAGSYMREMNARELAKRKKG